MGEGLLYKKLEKMLSNVEASAMFKTTTEWTPQQARVVFHGLAEEIVKEILDEAKAEFPIFLTYPNYPEGIIQMTIADYIRFCDAFKGWFEKWFGASAAPQKETAENSVRS